MEKTFADPTVVDDLVLRPYQMLATDPPAATRLSARWQAITVDEYQDVNDVQAALIGMTDPDLLASFPREAFIPAQNSDFDAIETTAKALGLLE